MASVKYQKIFNLFLGSITDLKLASLSEEDARMLMTEYLHKALAASYLSHLFDNVNLEDTTETLTYSMAYETDKDETDFVCNAIAKWMVYEWWSNQVNSVINSAQFFGGSEQKFYSQQAHMAELESLQENAYKRARQFVMDRGWINNSYLGGQ